MDHTPRFLALVEAAKRHVQELDVEEVRARQERSQPFHLVDVREDREWEAGHVEGAVHLGKGILERDVERSFPDPDTQLVLYCGGGFRSALAAEALQRMGYRHVSSMAGGWKAWLARGYPTK